MSDVKWSAADQQWLTVLCEGKDTASLGPGGCVKYGVLAERARCIEIVRKVAWPDLHPGKEIIHRIAAGRQEGEE